MRSRYFFKCLPSILCSWLLWCAAINFLRWPLS